MGRFGPLELVRDMFRHCDCGGADSQALSDWGGGCCAAAILEQYAVLDGLSVREVGSAIG